MAMPRVLCRARLWLNNDFSVISKYSSVINSVSINKCVHIQVVRQFRTNFSVNLVTKEKNEKDKDKDKDSPSSTSSSSDSDQTDDSDSDEEPKRSTSKSSQLLTQQILRYAATNECMSAILKIITVTPELPLEFLKGGGKRSQ